MSRLVRRIILVDAKKLAEDSGAPMSSNVVMIGALAGSGVTGIERRHFEKAIEGVVPRWVPENLDAFSKGYEAAARL